MSPRELLFNAIGTKWQINIYDNISTNTESYVLKIILEYIERFDKNYSRFRSDSLIHKMSIQKGIYKLPTDAEPMFSLYQDLYKLTDGAFTPLIGQLLSDAGYDAYYSLKEKNLQNPHTWDETLAYNYPTIEVKKPSILDFGAAGKGYLIDLVGIILKKNNILNFSINAGGDILYKNTQNQSIRVGLENPTNINQVIGVANINNQSICGSAGNRRKWGKFHHIMNPHTLSSPQNILATWVVADNALIADAIATCLFFTKSAKLSKYKFSYLILFSDSSIEKSESFPAELFYKQ